KAQIGRQKSENGPEAAACGSVCILRMLRCKFGIVLFQNGSLQSKSKEEAGKISGCVEKSQKEGGKWQRNRLQGETDSGNLLPSLRN
ncbi:MAG: hypothetical protein Q4C60_10090, partial [Eubacteriales bacterium]|nr:hypothetical protein [Eubacteriales bacterium]